MQHPLHSVSSHSVSPQFTSPVDTQSLFRRVPIQSRLQCHSQTSSICRGCVWCLDSGMCFDLIFPDVSNMLLLVFIFFSNFVWLCLYLKWLRGDFAAIVTRTDQALLLSQLCLQKCLLPGWLSVNLNLTSSEASGESWLWRTMWLSWGYPSEHVLFGAELHLSPLLLFYSP